MNKKHSIPGINQQAATDLPVLKPYAPDRTGKVDDLYFSRWLAATPRQVWWVLLASVLVWPVMASAASGYTMTQAFEALFKWIPFIVTGGFFYNVLISFFAMLIGTIVGVVLGLMQISPIRLISWPARFFTQVFRNSPWLVLLFIVLLALPFEFTIGDTIVRIPDWTCLLYTSPSPRDRTRSRMPSSA